MNKNVTITEEEQEAIYQVLLFSTKSKGIITFLATSQPNNPMVDIHQCIQLGKYESIVDDFLEKVKRC